MSTTPAKADGDRRRSIRVPGSWDVDLRCPDGRTVAVTCHDISMHGFRVGRVRGLEPGSYVETTLRGRGFETQLRARVRWSSRSGAGLEMCHRSPEVVDLMLDAAANNG